MITIFEDFAKSVEDEDFLDNVRKEPLNSYIELSVNDLKKKGKLKDKKKKVNTLAQTDGTFGKNIRDVSTFRTGQS